MQKKGKKVSKFVNQPFDFNWTIGTMRIEFKTSNTITRDIFSSINVVDSINIASYDFVAKVPRLFGRLNKLNALTIININLT